MISSDFVAHKSLYPEMHINSFSQIISTNKDKDRSGLFRQQLVKRKGKFGGSQKRTNYTLKKPLPHLVATHPAHGGPVGIPGQPEASEQAVLSPAA